MIRVLSAFLLALVIGVPIAAAEEAPPPPPPVTVPQPTPPPAVPSPRPDPKPSAQQPPAPAAQRQPSPPSRAPAPPAPQRSFQAKPPPAAVSTPRVRPSSAKKKPKPAQPKKKKPAQRKQQAAPPAPQPPVVDPRERRGLIEPTWISRRLLVAEPVADRGTAPAVAAYAVGLALVGLFLAVAAVPLAGRRRQRAPAVALPAAATTSENGNGVAGAAVIPVPERSRPEAAPARTVAPARPEDVAVAVEPAAEPALGVHEVARAADTAWERCEVRWWRGYVSSRFWAQSLENGQLPLCESPAFRWKGGEPPAETEAAVAAHEALLEQLRGEGWVVDGRGDVWYELAMRRRRPSSVGSAAPPTAGYEDVREDEPRDLGGDP